MAIEDTPSVTQLTPELTNEQIERQDFLHNTIYECMQKLIDRPGFELDWSIEEVGEVADALQNIAVKHGWTAMEFYPYVEWGIDPTKSNNTQSVEQ